MSRILSEGSNCWRIPRASRAAFIIDGEDYFRAVREAMCKARRTIFIIGWDIHTELLLIRNGENDQYPKTLGALLDVLARQRPELSVYVLVWDFSMIYAMEREFLPQYKVRWKSGTFVHFCLDGEHPVGASQHQKIVVVDDLVAFSGGLDLTKWRWDTSEHSLNDARRTGPDGVAYPPFHDVQMIVDGDAAAALGELARARWRCASDIEPVAHGGAVPEDPWPASIEPALKDIDVGIARTLPAHKRREEVREVERLYIDSIAAARRFMYIENQYLSSHRIGRALARRLEEAEGPEVIIVMPQQTDGWLEQHTMDVLRARLLRSIRQADRHNRLRVYYARLAQEPPVSLLVHAKVMIIDDRFVRVASSNLSNRSMGLDSECDLAIEAAGSLDCQEAIADFRRRLLGEHLNRGAGRIAQLEAEQPSLIAAIESLRGGVRSLEPLPADICPDIDEWVPDSVLLDPEKPVEPESLYDYFVGPGQHKPMYRQLFKTGLLLLGLLGLAALWRVTPLGDWLTIDTVSAAGRWIDSQPLTPLLVLVTYVLAGLVVVPITLMIFATVLVFGPWEGMAYALTGSLSSAVAGFGMGHLLGREVVRRLAGSRSNRLSRALSSRGVMTIVTLRVVPVAPFSIINVIAGISEISLRDFIIGSLIGLLPGIIGFALLTDRMVASLREPSAWSIVTMFASAAVVVLGFVGLRYWLRRKRIERNR